MDAHESSRWTTVGRHIGLAATTGLLIGLADGVVSARGGAHGALVGALFGGGLLALVGALIGLVQGPLVRLGVRALAKFGLVQKWRAMNTTAPETDRGPVIEFHAWMATALVVGGVLVAAFAIFMRASTAIKEPSLRDTVLVMFVAVAVGVMALAAALGRPMTRALMARMDRRFGLPFPRSGLLRYLAFIALPVGGVLLPMHAVYGVKISCQRSSTVVTKKRTRLF